MRTLTVADKAIFSLTVIGRREGAWPSSHSVMVATPVSVTVQGQLRRITLRCAAIWQVLIALDRAQKD
jgi:hypothetical protein